MDLKKKKEKEKALLNSILSQRKDSAKKISNIVRNILDKNISKKKFLIIKRIIITRNNSAVKIQSAFRSYLVFRNIQYYIVKARTCFLIESGFNEKFKNLQVKVYFNNNTSKIFDLSYDKFYIKNIFFMERTSVDEDTYNVQFIHEGRILIDSLYDTIEENEIYYNQINFKKIRKKEEIFLKKSIIEIQSACNILKQKGLLISSKKNNDDELFNKIDEEENDTNKMKTGDSLDVLNLRGNLKNEIPYKKLRSRFGSLRSSFSFHRKKSCLIKGILKIRSSNERKIENPGSKVKFGYIEFSC